MALDAEHRENLLEALRLIETARESLIGADDFDSVRIDGNLVTALSSTKAALAVVARTDEPQGS
ncbi:hypothetical protein [Rubrobacter indicoceani]|uniref:hypothetical protein n=1 Tax=Rubrobacter indicoceani TaxID=2051957 RepID=UPI000E5A8C1C|nr:hypothetical protein [Rubrobacter indicoceani]